VRLRPRAENVIEVIPLVPDDIWNYFCLGNVLFNWKLMTIVWDRTGEKYAVGRGLQVFADGNGRTYSLFNTGGVFSFKR